MRRDSNKGWCGIYEIQQDINEAHREINITSEYINCPIGEVAVIMLHEMVHLYNMVHEINDVSNNGYYHNKQIKDTAEAHSLHIEHRSAYEWTVTTLTAQTAEWLAQQPGMEDFTASRKTVFQIKLNGNDDNEDGNETTINVKGGGHATSKNCSLKYSCPKCGVIIRATKQVNVVCGDCDVAFKRA